VATVISFVIGLPGGPAGVAKAYFIVNVLVAFTLMLVATKGSPVRVADVILSLGPSLIAAGISWVLVRAIDDSLSPIALVVLGVPASYLIAVLAIWMSPHGREFLMELLRLTKSLRPSKTAI
jgi:PST family polysaccharide transporter